MQPEDGRNVDKRDKGSVTKLLLFDYSTVSPGQKLLTWNSQLHRFGYHLSVPSGVKEIAYFEDGSL